MAIAIDVRTIRHGLVGIGIGEEVFGFADNVLHVRADESECARSDALWALGLAPQDEDRLAEGGGLFLHAAGIGEDESALTEGGEELVVVERFAELDAGLIGENGSHIFTHRGIRMKREEKVNLGVHFREVLDGKGHRAHGRTNIFAAVAGHQDQFLRILWHSSWEVRGGGMANHPLQGIHHGVSRNEDRVFRDVFCTQKRRREIGWGKVPVRKAAEHDAVEFLGKWRVAVVRAQARLHMCHGDFMVKCTESTHKGARGVTLHNDGVDAVSTKQLPETGAEQGGEVPEALAWTHDAEVEVGSDAKAAENLRRHLSVLGCGDREWLKRLGCLQASNHWGQLDGLGARANDHSDGFFG